MKKLTKYSQLKEEFDTTKAKLQEEGAQLQEIETRYKNYEKERSQLQKKADQVENLRDKNIRDNENLIKKWEKALETATKKYEARQKDFNEIEMDLKSKQAFIDEYQKDIDDAIAAVKECEKNLAEAEEEVQKFMEHYNKVEHEYNNADAERSKWFEEAKGIQDQIKALDEKKEAAEINKMKRNNVRQQCQDHVDYCASEIEKLRDNFKDINFDAEARPAGGKSATTVKKELDIITKKLEDMHQRLDHEAAAALQHTEKDFTSSTEKLSMIEKNKKNLIKAIQTLDDAKKRKVKIAYDNVNEKFNGMMQTLLPEAKAKLVEVSPGDLSQGVNIHVQLGGVWKESLTELSGGQRSLVALSLVLSLCMYNPAPFYILDEVDAALDLSHTQNIGVVIQNQFKGTQFICVSLKDGMFSNANVLFTAKHEGGKSVVTRIAKGKNQGIMPPPAAVNENKKKTKNR
ncbi:Structural maintenance of chromosomes protein 2 [Orchesella cincta]|uniref:Structural maintenance of chromosomes protein 2 n=1 Tax=Orchesella cincta TaxID=48709 RepID=A0A1D2NHW1_ORCCI|nr:Structural maintenance of chromosomes protein 2 [Orchesella cincta]